MIKDYNKDNEHYTGFYEDLTLCDVHKIYVVFDSDEPLV
jgi:hypothetical protein